MKAILKKKIQKIKLLVMDVDGVLTDGTIALNNEGSEIKLFNVQDGYGLVLLREAGIKTAILSARSSGAVTIRGKDLKIDKICQDAYPKQGVYRQLIQELGLTDEDVCFVGDDLPDLAVLRRVGVAVAVPNAVGEVKEAAHYITKSHGGRGAVREIVELILKVQGKWEKILTQLG